ncbi:MAG TPA: NUDIX domain-containing protein [Symbiobacteriaceae bacterium]|nr:NUDIX domain-containing protein [Symbiobacteriaceae bacterium]
MTEAVWGPAEASLGRPGERNWSYEIGEAEMDMVVSSTRGQTRLHDVTIFIFNAGGEAALIKKHSYPPGAWRAPGGGINPGEPFAFGARREAREETGLDVRLTRYLLRIHVTFTCGERRQPWTTHVVAAQAAGSAELAVGDPKEIAGARWGTLDELCGPIADVMLASGSGLFRYRVALHREVARLLAGHD